MFLLLGLAVLSVVGAFLGAERARDLFRSTWLWPVWALLLAGTLASIVAFARLMKWPDLLAMHAGLVLLLAGAMLGSESAHEIAARLGGTRPIHTGYMVLPEGGQSKVVTDDRGRPIGQLPFTIRLQDFRIEYYPAEDPRWLLLVNVPSHGADIHRIDWTEGRPTPIGAGAELTVLQYIPRARGSYEDGTSRLVEVIPPTGPAVRLPARPGASADLQPGGYRVEVIALHEHLRVEASETGAVVANDPDAPPNPGVEVELTDAEGNVRRQFAFRRPLSHPLPGAWVQLRYIPAEPTAAEPDEDSDTPAMHIAIDWDGARHQSWLAPPDGAEHTDVYVLAPPGADPSRRLSLQFARPTGMIRDFKSDLLVLEEDAPAARKIIEVNHPLHYGGYYFSQNRYDVTGGREYSILMVTSDAGVLIVLAGGLLLWTGLAGYGWARPAVRWLAARRRHGD